MTCYAIKKGPPVAQGDMQMQMIERLPDGLTEVEPENGKYILTHSESGHHHSVKVQSGVKMYQNDNNPLVAFLVVDNTKEKCLVEHERSFDTHAPYEFENGVYVIRRQIETDDSPEGWRRAID